MARKAKLSYVDEYGVDEDDDHYELLKQLSLVHSMPGESVDLAVDKAGTFYCVHRLTPVRLEGLARAQLDAHLATLGNARWYFAYFEAAADDLLNLDVAKEFARSMKDHGHADAALAKRVAARAKKVAAYRKQRAAAERAADKAEKAAAKPANVAKAAIAAIAKEAAENQWSLAVAVDAGALAAGIRTGQLAPAVAWKFVDGLRCLPPDLLPAVLAAKRDGKQDRYVWDRVDQLVGVAIPPGTKLDALIADAAIAAARLGGAATKKLPPRYVKAIGDLLSTRLRDRTLPGEGAHPSAAKIKSEVAYLRAMAVYERDRLAAAGDALVGRAAFTKALEQAFRATIYDRNKRYAPGALLLAARVITFDDAFEITQKTDDRGALLELALAKKWKADKLAAEAVRLAAMGFSVEAWQWVAKQLAKL